MSEPFTAEVRIFAGNFAPRGWAFCNGQLLPIAQNTALFSLIGTTYGGDGRTTTALPNLQGRAPMHPGRGPGLTSRRLGQRGGAEMITLSEAQMANHTHQLRASNDDIEEEGGDKGPTNGYTARMQANQSIYSGATNLVDMASESLSNTGGSQAHNNMQPFLTLSFIIALVGLYPSRG
ncbi:MAG: tail fiber protein [Pseudomonadota bacterium]